MGPYRMTKYIENSPLVMIEEINVDDNKVIHLANMKKTATGYFQFEDDSIVTFLNCAPKFIIFEQNKLRYIKSDDDFSSIKDKLKSKLVVLKNQKHLVFNKPKNNSMLKLFDVVKSNSNNKIEPSEALTISSKIENFDKRCLKLIKAKKSKSRDQSVTKSKKKVEKEDSEDDESDSKSDESESTSEEEDTSSGEDGSDEEKE